MTEDEALDLWLWDRDRGAQLAAMADAALKALDLVRHLETAAAELDLAQQCRRLERELETGFPLNGKSDAVGVPVERERR